MSFDELLELLLDLKKQYPSCGTAYVCGTGNGARATYEGGEVQIALDGGDDDDDDEDW